MVFTLGFIMLSSFSAHAENVGTAEETLLNESAPQAEVSTEDAATREPAAVESGPVSEYDLKIMGAQYYSELEEIRSQILNRFVGQKQMIKVRSKKGEASYKLSVSASPNEVKKIISTLQLGHRNSSLKSFDGKEAVLELE